MLRITAVTPLAGLRVHVALTDGTERDLDLTPYLWGPVFEPILADRELFEQVYVDPVSKTIAWPNGADIDADVLVGGEQPAVARPNR
jgi:hypothetical protein